MYKVRRMMQNVIRHRKRGDTKYDINEEVLNKGDNLENNRNGNGMERLSTTNLDDRSDSRYNSLKKIKYDENNLDEDSHVNKDSAIFRFRDGTSKIVGDGEFAAKLSLSANDSFWKQIYSAHTLVKSRYGLGTTIIVNFIQYEQQWKFTNDPTLPPDKY